MDTKYSLTLCTNEGLSTTQSLSVAQYEAFLDLQKQDGHVVMGRVAVEYKHIYRVLTEQGEQLAEVSGKLRHAAIQRIDYPAVGDLVVLRATPSPKDKSVIHAVLPRKSQFSRKMAGLETEEQIVATNVDTVFLVNALTTEVNVRRLERYLLLTWASGAKPVVVLTKADQVVLEDMNFNELERVTRGIPYHIVSAASGLGMDALQVYLSQGETVALLGSSGAGKSTLVNALMGEDVERVQAVREDDDKGRHTTTHRELHILPTGGVLMDTPGMRELQLWSSDTGISETFEDVLAYANMCKFGDCQHRGEPGCAVEQALAQGLLSGQRIESYRKLQKELLYIARKEDQRLSQVERKKWKNLTMEQRRNRHHS